jgi:hypothetical protein
MTTSWKDLGTPINDTVQRNAGIFQRQLQIFKRKRADEKLVSNQQAFPQRLKRLRKNSKFRAQPLKGRLISKDLRYR